MLSQELIKELKTIILEDYGIDLDFEDVFEIGNSFVEIFELLAKIQYQKGLK